MDVYINSEEAFDDNLEKIENFLVGVDTYGSEPRSVYMQWLDAANKAAEIVGDILDDGESNYTIYSGIYNGLKVISGMTGIAFASLTREVVTVWNNTAGAMAPGLKVKTYDAGDLSEIRYAYMDGYLTEEEATELLLSKGLVEDKDEAYWKIREWDAGGDFSRYDAVFQAVRSGENISGPMEELTDNGYTVKQVKSEIKGQIGKWFRSGEITQAEASSMLKHYIGLTDAETEKEINRWRSELETGIAYDDIHETYVDPQSTLSADSAKRYLMEYGGYSEKDAQEKVEEWNFEKDHGYAYSETEQLYKDGALSYGELLDILTGYGGKTEENAKWIIAQYDWEKEVEGSDGIWLDSIKGYFEYAEPAGVSKSVFTEVWKIRQATKGIDEDGDGEADRNTVAKQVIPQIGKLRLTAEQKTAIALCFWTKKTVNTYKTW